MVDEDAGGDGAGCAVIRAAVVDGENRSLQKKSQWDETHTEGWDPSGEGGAARGSEAGVKRVKEDGSDQTSPYL